MLYETAYPVTLTPDETDGGFVVTFVDFPEAITQGETVEEALVEAADALDEAIAGRLWEIRFQIRLRRPLSP
jgi:antitoxin HicB